MKAIIKITHKPEFKYYRGSDGKMKREEIELIRVTGIAKNNEALEMHQGEKMYEFELEYDGRMNIYDEVNLKQAMVKNGLLDGDNGIVYTINEKLKSCEV